MESRLIIMLTHNDRTVTDAQEIFDRCKDLPVQHWGFKDVGICKSEMVELCNNMRNANKKTFLEVVTYTEKDCLNGAKLAVELEVDYLMGTIYYPAVFDYLATQKVAYLPFCGKVSGSPSVLEGEIEDIIYDAEGMLCKGIFGIDLLAFRHKNGEELARKCMAKIKQPVVIAGSIGSSQRLEFVSEVNPWGYTMGSALFTQNFVKDGDFRQNLEKVLSITDSLK